MTLLVQIQSLFVSFMYGIFFSLLFNITYKFVTRENLTEQMKSVLHGNVIEFTTEENTTAEENVVETDNTVEK